jgi:hypothetical protein
MSSRQKYLLFQIVLIVAFRTLVAWKELMSALGQKQTSAACTVGVRFTPESGHVQCTGHVRFGPIADISSGYSITSSAVASSVGDIVRPISLAVFRLITSLYLVGACTGRSAGFSPLRMRST